MVPEFCGQKHTQNSSFLFSLCDEGPCSSEPRRECTNWWTFVSDGSRTIFIQCKIKFQSKAESNMSHMRAKLVNKHQFYWSKVWTSWDLSPVVAPSHLSHTGRRLFGQTWLIPPTVPVAGPWIRNIYGLSVRFPHYSDMLLKSKWKEEMFHQQRAQQSLSPSLINRLMKTEPNLEIL